MANINQALYADKSLLSLFFPVSIPVCVSFNSGRKVPYHFALLRCRTHGISRKASELWINGIVYPC